MHPFLNKLHITYAKPVTVVPTNTVPLHTPTPHVSIELRPTGKLSPVIPRQQPDQPHPNYSVFLPAVGAGRSFTTAIHILAPSLVTNGTDQEGKEGVSHAWTHQVSCAWTRLEHTYIHTYLTAYCLMHPFVSYKWPEQYVQCS